MKLRGKSVGVLTRAFPTPSTQISCPMWLSLHLRRYTRTLRALLAIQFSYYNPFLDIRAAGKVTCAALQIFENLCALSRQRAANTSELQVSDEHRLYLKQCARRLYLEYHETSEDDGWLEIASLTLSYLHTALRTVKAYTDRSFYVCWRLATKVYGGSYDLGKNVITDRVYRECSLTDGSNELESCVLNLLNWQMTVVTECGLVDHLVGSLEPTMAAQILDSAKKAAKDLLPHDGWAFVQRLQDPRVHAVERVCASLAQAGIDFSRCQRCSVFRRCVKS
jgi:hypothetical protein